MSAILFVAKLLIVAFTTVHYGSYGSNTNEDAFYYYQSQLTLAKSYKHEHCMASNLTACGGSIYASPDKKIVRWHYVPTTRRCSPVYMHRDQTIACEDFKNLPMTLKECEDLCGEPCIITYPSKLSEPGICMLDCHIPPPIGRPRPCPEDSKCCPRNYILPTTTPVPVTTKKP